MSLFYRGVMKENELSRFGKSLIVLCIVVPGVIFALINIFHREVKHPGFVWLILGGFVCFAIGKFSVITKKKVISFGPKLMTENMANIYRVGYFLMSLGIILMFNE